MIPFIVSEAVRRVRRRQPHVVRDGRLAMGRLLLDEASGLARAPASLMVISGLAAAGGTHVALGTGYPGPVAPEPLRWALTLAIVIAVAGLLRTAPATWGQVRNALGRARLILAAVCFAGVVSAIKVGLHDTTPGPALPAAGRWAAVVLAGVALVLGGRRDAR